MTKEVQFRRGSTEDHVAVGAGFTGALAEVTVDTTNNTLRVHDGTTKGGHELVGVAVTQRISNKDVVAIGLTVSGISTFDGSVNANQGLSVSGGLDVTYGATSDRLNVTGISTFGLQVNLIEGQAVVWHDGNNNNAARIYATSNDEIRIDNTSSNIERLRIKSSGNIGIGTTDPVAKLQIGIGNGNGGFDVTTNPLLSVGGSLVDSATYIRIGKRVTSAESNLPFITHGSYNNSGNDLILGAHSSTGKIRFFTGNSDNDPMTGSNVERLTINQVGNVGIGSTDVTEKLHVLGNIKTSGNILNELGNRFLVGVSTVTVLTSGTGATYTPPANLISALVIATGGGGGGGGADGTDVTSASGGSGGAAGSTAIRVYTATELGATATYTIGAGTAGGSNAGGDSTTGGTTTFTPAGSGTALSAVGGGAGQGTQTAGNAVHPATAGGVATGGQINIEGGDGTGGFGVDGELHTIAGNGGASFWGGGGGGAILAATGTGAGLNGTAYGSGGGGAACQDTTTGSAGGTGKDGVIFVLEFTG